MWVGLGDGGVCRYRDGQFDELAANKGPLHSGIRYLLEDRHGRMWCAGRGMLGYCEGDDYRDLMPQLRTLLDRKPGEQVPFLWSIVEDDEGVIWFRDIFDPDLLAFDGNRLHKVDLAGVSGGGFDLELHPSAGLWIGANQGGRKSGDAPLWRYEEQTCEPCGVLVEGAVRRIRVDSSGRTWLATTGGGVLYSEDDGFS